MQIHERQIAYVPRAYHIAAAARAVAQVLFDLPNLVVLLGEHDLVVTRFTSFIHATLAVPKFDQLLVLSFCVMVASEQQLSVSPVTPLLTIDWAQTAIFISPRVPELGAELINVRFTTKEPQGFFDESVRIDLLTE